MRASKQSDARARSRADDRVGRAGRGGRSPTLLPRFPDVRICAIAQLRMRSSRSTCRGLPRRGARGASVRRGGGRVRPAPSARVAPRGRRAAPETMARPPRGFPDSRGFPRLARCCCGLGPCCCCGLGPCLAECRIPAKQKSARRGNQGARSPYATRAATAHALAALVGRRARVCTSPCPPGPPRPPASPAAAPPARAPRVRIACDARANAHMRR